MAGKTSWRVNSRDADQRDVEDKRRVRRDTGSRTRVAVRKLRRNDQAELAAHYHSNHALFPPFDHRAGAARERETRQRLELFPLALGLRRVVQTTCIANGPPVA